VEWSSCKPSTEIITKLSLTGIGEGPITDDHIFCIHELVGVDWKRVLRKLSVDNTTIRNLEEDYKYSEVAEKCYQGLLKWKKSHGPEKATIDKLCDALQSAGCQKALRALRTMSHQCDA